MTSWGTSYSFECLVSVSIIGSSLITPHWIKNDSWPRITFNTTTLNTLGIWFETTSMDSGSICFDFALINSSTKVQTPVWLQTVSYL